MTKRTKRRKKPLGYVEPIGKRLPMRIRKFVVSAKPTGWTASEHARALSTSETVSRKDVEDAIARISSGAEQAAAATDTQYSLRVQASSGRGAWCQVNVEPTGRWFPWKCFSGR